MAASEVTWSSGFCDCCADLSICCMSCWCPCVTFGRIAEIVDRGSTSCGTGGALYVLIAAFTGCACIYSCFYRGKMRKQYNLKGDGCTDCLTHFFCETCALTQEYRELQSRGFDMSLGWQSNSERQNTGLSMGAPVVEGAMKR